MIVSIFSKTKHFVLSKSQQFEWENVEKFTQVLRVLRGKKNLYYYKTNYLWSLLTGLMNIKMARDGWILKRKFCEIFMRISVIKKTDNNIL